MPKSKHQIPGRVRSACEFMKAHRSDYSIQMCRVLEVAPSGYYDWLIQPVSNRAQEDARLSRLIRATFVASHGIYGAPRVFLDLREAGETCNKHRVACLMRQNNLRALHGYRTRRVLVGKASVLIPNLLKREFASTPQHFKQPSRARSGRRGFRMSRLLSEMLSVLDTVCSLFLLRAASMSASIRARYRSVGGSPVLRWSARTAGSRRNQYAPFLRREVDAAQAGCAVREGLTLLCGGIAPKNGTTAS